MLGFLYDYFHTYDITTEIVMLILIVVLMSIMAYSKPEKTYMYRLFASGLGMAAILVVLHVWLLGETIVMRQSHNIVFFNILYVIYSWCFVTELNLIFMYQTQLSYRRRSQRRQISNMARVFTLVWLPIMLYPLVTGKLLEYKDGVYTFSAYSNVYVLCSFLCTVVVVGVTAANIKDISRIVYWGSIIFIPIEIIGILAQLYFPTAYFICATYTIPFIIYFVLFHTNKYDEVTGCQRDEAERTTLDKFIKEKQRFVQISISLPKMEARDYSEIEKKMIYVCNYYCRALEKLDRRVRIYEINTFNYNILCPVKDDEEADRIETTILDLVRQPLEIGGKMYKTTLHILVSRDYENIESAQERIALLKMKRSQFEASDADQIIHVTKEDAAKYKKRAIIEKNLLDIQNRGDLDDERVLVYIQPIYSIKEDCYRTGESLMRMQIDGKMVFPDEFIPVAEHIGCIHALTRIMLHKVAKKTVELDSQYNYDALTVNVSTMELTDPNVNEEFVEIIMAAGADPSKIRIEITESTTISDYGVIIENIRKMKEKGIHFYLDDFGTGYSNLDRMVSIPFKTIKFDKSLLYKALEDTKSEELFLLLIKFFKSNGFDTVIEGVENDAQREYVKKAGFDYIQGYFYSKPIPEVEANQFFAKDK